MYGLCGTGKWHGKPLKTRISHGNIMNTLGTAGGPGGRDRTLAVKRTKNRGKTCFFCIYLLFLPKYWVKNYFTHGRFREVGQKQMTEKKKERKRERGAKVGENNGQATHGARKHAWRTQAAWAKSFKFTISC